MAGHTTPQRAGLYYPKMSNTWWLKRPNYIRFMIREATSVFIAAFLVVFLVQLCKLGQAPAAYEGFLQTLRAPGWIAFHVIALAFALYHSITWFNLTGVVQVVKIGDFQVPPILVVAGAFAAWGAVSIGVFLFFFLKA
jgi:fumarate reductase subunit C